MLSKLFLTLLKRSDLNKLVLVFHPMLSLQSVLQLPIPYLRRCSNKRLMFFSHWLKVERLSSSLKDRLHQKDVLRALSMRKSHHSFRLLVSLISKNFSRENRRNKVNLKLKSKNLRRQLLTTLIRYLKKSEMTMPRSSRIERLRSKRHKSKSQCSLLYCE